jgi:hypothetical protein
MRAVEEMSSMEGSSELLGENARAEEWAMDDRMDREATPEPCDDDYAALDLAGLQVGTLTPDEVSRLAGHLERCKTCKIVVVMFVVERIPAEGTGKHAIPEEWMERARQ